MDVLQAALLDGNHKGAVIEARRLLAAGVTREAVVTEGLAPAMGCLDAKCTIRSFNLLEIMLVGRAVSGVVQVLYPDGEPPGVGRATLVIATLEGDVHDLGKNIVKMVLIGRGYRVVDCGKDCPVETLAATALRERAAAVLVSGLISSIIPRVRQVRPALAAAGLATVPILAGGAALKQCAAADLDVDAVAETAFDGVHLVDSWLGVPP